MNPRGHRRLRNALLAVLLAGIAVWLIPSFFSAEHYRHRLEANLERTIHRPVTFRKVSPRLLPRLGFIIEDAVIQEDPAFGSEPFIRVDRIECDIRWQSLMGSRLDFSHLRFEHPNINLVRKVGEGWNVERLLLQNEPTYPAERAGSSPVQGSRGPLDFELVDGRINFKLGERKKAFAVTDLRAQVSFDPAYDHLQFRLLGDPVRSDISLPTPGTVEVIGEWTPGRNLRGPMKAVVRTSDALLYDWVPLIIGRDAGIYGVLDAELRVAGSVRALDFEGSGRLTELHRWEQIPPSDPMPCTVTLRGKFDWDQGRVQLSRAETGFADSLVDVSGTIDHLPNSPEMDLVVALERSRLEDLAALAGRFWTLKRPLGITGRVDAMLSIQGPWTQKRYGGFIGARDVVLSTRSGNFPVSEIAVRIDNRWARLAPVRISLAPRVAIEAEGSLDRGTKPFRYDLTLSTKAVPLGDVMDFGRAVGLHTLQDWDATGSGTATVHFTGSVPSTSRPILKGRAEFRAARFVIPGFTEPINVPRASVQFNGDQIVVDHMLAVLGTSVFSGRFTRQVDPHSPWVFDLHTDNLDLEQGASWFVALGRRKPSVPALRLPGRSSYAAGRVAASNIFNALNARGQFSASKLTFRNLSLDNFRTNGEVGDRVIQVTKATFRVGGGQGRFTGKMDLATIPAHLDADVSLSGAGVQLLAPYLPPALRGLSGTMSINGHFDTTGLSRDEISENLDGRAALMAGNLSLGDFDPTGALVRLAGAGALEPLRGPVGFRSVTLNFQVRDERVILRKAMLESAGAKLSLSGTYSFDGEGNLHVAADLRRLQRRWQVRVETIGMDSIPLELNFSGSLDKLAPVTNVTPAKAGVQANPERAGFPPTRE